MSNSYEYYKQKADKLYKDRKQIYSPYFKINIKLNSDGLHHLRFSNQKERNKNEQILKFKLLPSAFKIIGKSHTLQEYRKQEISIRPRYSKNHSRNKRIIQYFGFTSINPNLNNRIKVILKKSNKGDLIFWSVMIDGKFKSQ